MSKEMHESHEPTPVPCRAPAYRNVKLRRETYDLLRSMRSRLISRGGGSLPEAARARWAEAIAEAEAHPQARPVSLSNVVDLCLYLLELSMAAPIDPEKTQTTERTEVVAKSAKKAK